ncbi:ABC transporter substrate-binding protein [Streptomyces sp. JJ36]|uniref:ABC transporter substrate-binding protein n=1 Tax=Streptomyces sp. JJ36 TaxID=2736645 RepID=UPI001F3C59D2|nr:ABC transporter substrate-binding protein [Streptomyces sp. JJ36]MCF6526362.1 carbohydrate ABC transporter substrate-binding protein [Streptomyces sp. JJ36]
MTRRTAAAAAALGTAAGSPARRGRTTRAAAAVAAALALSLTAACGGGDGEDTEGGSAPDAKSTVDLPKLDGETVQISAVWTGPEQKNFEKVLAEFEKRTGAEVEFVPSGDNVATFIGSKVEGGAPPDVAMVAQVGVVKQFAEKGWLKPVTPETQKQLEKNYAQGWQDLGAVGGKQYGVYFKAANKSLMWYNTTAFENAGVGEAKTWDEFLQNAQTIADSGVEPVSVGGADGWTLTDWFENIYLSQAGPEKYDQLAAHEIKWTDPSVKKALTTLGELFGKDQLLVGGNDGALQTAFPESVTQTFSDTEAPKAAVVFEGDFVGVNIKNDTEAKIGEDAKVFPFPAVGDESPVVTGGDAAVRLKDSKGGKALMTFLASTDAAAIMAEQGGFVSPNKGLDTEVYPDDVQRKIAEALIAAGDDFRFDMSDQAPAAFGGTKGEGEWKALQDFLKKPDDVEGAQRALEDAAAQAFGN